MSDGTPQEEWLSEREPPVIRGQSDFGVGRHLRFDLRQSFSYRYSAPVRNVDQRLVIVPPREHGAQKRVFYRITLDGMETEYSTGHDEFGNTVVSLRVPYVAESVEFRVEAEVARVGSDDVILPASALYDPRYLEATSLTIADDRLRAAALTATESAPTAFIAAEQICHLVHEAITYQKGATSVGTTAAEAFAIGKGVCQDHAHVMLAICRAAGIPARYVSGHLLGEGSTHAWVEVLLPHRDLPGQAIALPFDPCHRRRADATYVTVAVGRDYHDVAPASGSYIGRATNELRSSTWLGVREVRHEE